MASKKKAAVKGQSTAKLSPKEDNSWTLGEQAILEEGLKKYCSKSRVNYCIQIANDIASRSQWMADNKKGYFADPAVNLNKVEGKIEKLLEHNNQALQLIKARISGAYGESQKLKNESLFFQAYHNIRKLKERVKEVPGGEILIDELMTPLKEEILFSNFPVKEVPGGEILID